MTVSGVFCRWNIGCLRAVTAALPETVTVLRTTTVSTPGGWTQNYVATMTIAGRLMPSGAPQEIPVAAELASVTHWRLETPQGTVLQMTDRVTIASQPGKTWEVVGRMEHSFDITNTYYLAEVLRL